MKVPVIDDIIPGVMPNDIFQRTEPVVLKGLVANWVLVQDGLKSDEKIINYLRSFYNGLTVGGYFGDPSIEGKYFYNNDVSGLNFDKKLIHLDKMLDLIVQHLYDEKPPALYVGSTTIDACLPGMRANNNLVFPHLEVDPLASIWLGNKSVVPSHYDVPTNLACCVAGKRRFTLFPPEQINNLYPGPLEPTPGGQVVSMVDFAAPDFERFPRVREAMKFAQVADLEPGDALFIPSMWWHQVEAQSRFNILINYWWSVSPRYMGSPMNALYHALLSIRDRPEQEKKAWKAVFDYYVFDSADLVRAHLPEQIQGNLAPLDEKMARQLRAYLLNRLNN